MIDPTKINIGDRIKCIRIPNVLNNHHFKLNETYKCEKSIKKDILFCIKIKGYKCNFGKTINNKENLECFELVQDFKVGDKVKIIYGSEKNRIGIIDSIDKTRLLFNVYLDYGSYGAHFGYAEEELELVKDDLVNEFNEMIKEKCSTPIIKKICCDKPNIKTNFVYPNGIYDPIAFKVCSNCKKEVI